MKVITVQEANFEDCIRDAQKERVVLTRGGKPVAILVGVAGLDLEQIELGHSDEFWNLIRGRRRQRRMSRKELETKLAKQ